MNLKRGDLVKIKHNMALFCETVAWSVNGDKLSVSAGTIFEVLDVKNDGNQRFWIPEFQRYVSALRARYNADRFIKINLISKRFYSNINP